MKVAGMPAAPVNLAPPTHSRVFTRRRLGARRCKRWVRAVVLVAGFLLGQAGTAPGTAAPPGIAGDWVGTWKSARSPAHGRFSAALSTKPAWWGDVVIVGTEQFAGAACAARLHVSGSYYRGDEYLLTAKSLDGTIRATAAVTVANLPRRSLSGHYEMVPNGAGCGPDSGRLDATVR
jgi:hypothetical protein